MKLDLQKCGYAAIVTAVSAAFVLGTAATGFAKEKKKAETASKPMTCWFAAQAQFAAIRAGRDSPTAMPAGLKKTAPKWCPARLARKRRPNRRSEAGQTGKKKKM